MAKGGRPVRACDCAICNRYEEFSMPRDLIGEVAGGNAVIIVGPGVSTEIQPIQRNSLLESVAAELDVDRNDREDLSEEILSRYCEQPNGRQKLINKIKEREEFICAFPELYNVATKFHRELSTIYQIQEIITTSWDDYFERECAATPFVTDDDLAVRRVEGRKVFKIHGSVNNLGSIVATRQDYAGFYDRLRHGELERVLSEMLWNKAVIYFGYTPNNKYFMDMHNILEGINKRKLADFYIVTPETENIDHLSDLNIVPITTASHRFLKSLKEHLQADGRSLPDESFDGLADIGDEVSRLHTDVISRFDLGKYPAAMLTACYQDGLLHVLQRIERRLHSGEYSFVPKIERVLRSYDYLREERLRSGSYLDAAYLEGYRNGVALVLQSEEERKRLPMLYIFGLDKYPETFDEFKKKLDRAEEIHKQSYILCQKFVEEHSEELPDILFHHRPFI